MAEQIGEMKGLTKLNLAECNMTDKGVTVLLKGLAPLLQIDTLDFSGNLIGKSPFFGQCATQLVEYLGVNGNLETFALKNNMLRGPNAAAIMEAICKMQVLQTLELS